MGVHILWYLLFTICKLCKEEEGPATGLHRNKFICQCNNYMHVYNQDTQLCVSDQENNRCMAHKCVIYWYCKVAKFSLPYHQN